MDGGLRSTDATPGAQFSLLPPLTRLWIALREDIDSSIHWVNVRSDLRRSIQLTLARPDFTCLESSLASRTYLTFNVNLHSAISACARSPLMHLEHLSLSRHEFQLHRLTDRMLNPNARSTLTPWITRVQRRWLPAAAPSWCHGPDFAEPCRSKAARNVMRFPLNLHPIPQLHTLKLSIWVDIYPPSGLRLVRLHGNIQALALTLDIYTQNAHSKTVRLGQPDRALAVYPYITRVTVVSPPWDRNEMLSDAFVEELPLLRERVAERGEVHVKSL
ncbi:hypothetical protein K438DRAFT_1978588 [Mycena galopus ATCC 62051]|nr:hypothetical protein K438DRAFT_1978588 [Mycena galopus ATCC 62051]